MTTSSAPGKIILFGEHAVVYGRPALAVPVTQVRATVMVSSTDSATGSRIGTDCGEKDWQARIRIEAPDIFLSTELSRLAPDHPLAAATRSVFITLGIPPHPSPLSRRERGRGEDMTIHITSTIPVASGLGSGTAVSVALIRALSSTVHCPLPDAQVNTLAYEIEKLHHGTPSGIDNTVITYAKPVYFVKGQPIEVFRVGAPFTIVIADTGVSALTKESVGDVRELWKADKTRWEKVFDEIGKIARFARKRIENGEWMALGPLMDKNHTLLQQLTVSSPELDRLVEAAHRSGALGAKLSGGGRGGNMIALVHKENAPAVVEALLSAGAKRIIVTTIQPK
jgi:mevalonate kinase